MATPEGAPKIPCGWPDCLSSDARERLDKACEYALRDEIDPQPDLTDYRTLHNCYEPKGFV